MKRSRVVIIPAVAVMLAAAGIVGCSGQPPLVPVKATVKLDGQPIEFCAVCFYWADPTTDLSRAGFGRGITEKDGTTIVKDMYGRDGMFPGRYKVTFEKYVAADGSPISLNSKPSEIYGGSKNMLPKKYHSPDTTDIVVEVPPSGLQTVFELKSK
jgi:hypothetical protein